jgi:hypothetical protein
MRDRNRIILQKIFYSIGIRLFISGFIAAFSIVIVSYFRQITNDSYNFRLMDVVAIIFICLFFVWFLFLFTDGWKFFIVNEDGITQYLFSIVISHIQWNDVVQVLTGKTNQIMNFVQCDTLIIISRDRKKIIIPKKMRNYNVLCKYCQGSRLKTMPGTL